ncbi:MAG: hypothetical protein HUU46_19690 [Candidatus Hydrogenedentes bacterium]|nr:hypothetical protein [Candidatus Hydrogenedentota bacterium]
MLLATLHSAAQEPSFAKQLLLQSIRNRESVETKALHATVRVEVEGPASALVVPTNKKGEVYKQLNVQDWWVDDQKIAVATQQESKCWLDGELISSSEPGENPQFVYTYDGERAFYLDYREGGQTIEVNTRWPFSGTSHPVLFGRAYANIPISECMAGGFEMLRSEDLDGQPCEVVEFPFGSGRVNCWIAKTAGNLALREEFYSGNGRVLSRQFRFTPGPSGMLRPESGTEVRHASRGGDVTTTWTVTAFDIDAERPEYVFTPNLEKAAKVIDGATKEVVKGPDVTSATNN